MADCGVPGALYRLAAYPYARVRVCGCVLVGSGSSDLDANVTTDRILFQSQDARAVILLCRCLSPSLCNARPPPSRLPEFKCRRISEHGPFALEASHWLCLCRSSPQILSPGTDAVLIRTFLSRPAATKTVSAYSSVSFLIQFPDRRQLAHWTMGT